MALESDDFDKRVHRHEWFFETLANPLRMRIILLLMQKPRSVSEIVAACREEQSKVSHALSILLLCNLVRISKKGRMHIYEIANSKIKQILKLVDKEFCSACKNPCAQHARKQSLRNRLNPKKE